MPSSSARRSFKSGRQALSWFQSAQSMSRTGTMVKPRYIDAYRATPHPGGIRDQRVALMQNNLIKQISFPEDKLYSHLYQRLPILRLELGAAQKLSDIRGSAGMGDGGRPLLAQRMVRRQLLYMDNGMTEQNAYARVRSEFSEELDAFRHLIRRDDIKEELAAALTADVTSLQTAHRVWVDTITARVTGFNPVGVHFRSVQSDGLPTLRELLLKSMPATLDEKKPTTEVQALLSELSDVENDYVEYSDYTYHIDDTTDIVTDIDLTDTADNAAAIDSATSQQTDDKHSTSQHDKV